MDDLLFDTATLEGVVRALPQPRLVGPLRSLVLEAETIQRTLEAQTATHLNLHELPELTSQNHERFCCVWACKPRQTQLFNTRCRRN